MDRYRIVNETEQNILKGNKNFFKCIFNKNLYCTYKEDKNNIQENVKFERGIAVHQTCLRDNPNEIIIGILPGWSLGSAVL